MTRYAHEVRREQEAKAQQRPYRNLFDVLRRLAEDRETGPQAAQQVRNAAHG